MQFDRITDRNGELCRRAAYGRPLRGVKLVELTQEITPNVQSGMRTRDIDFMVVRLCASKAMQHPDYGDLAARILVDDLHKATDESILAVTHQLAAANTAAASGVVGTIGAGDESGAGDETGTSAADDAYVHEMLNGLGLRPARSSRRSRLRPEYAALVERFADEIDQRLRFAEDYRFDYFGIETMRRSYLLGVADDGEPAGKRVYERPQHAYMRVALCVCCCQADGRAHELPEDEIRPRLQRAFEVYDQLARHLYTHASPTMFNAGARYCQLSSCFLFAVDDDMGVLLGMLRGVGLCSQRGGGIGLCVTPMRGLNARIGSTGGRVRRGVQGYGQLHDALQRYADQGSMRPGAFALYLEVWHSDIFTFLEMGRHKGPLHARGEAAPHLKYALWVPDLFMEALEAELAEKGKPLGEQDPTAGDWHLFSPDEAPGLHRVYDACRGDCSLSVGGDKTTGTGERQFTALYRHYVRKGRYRRVVKASELMQAWFESVAQLGYPYLLFKDAVNRKSNLSHVRTISNSNLCAEITIPAWEDEGRPEEAEYAVCNLGALNLASFVVPDAAADSPGRVRVDFPALAEAAGGLLESLDNIIDINHYPVEACRRSNLRHRPVGIGTSGLADVLACFRYAFGSLEARRLDEALHATVLWGALDRSAALAQTRGSFESFSGSPAARGLLQPDLWERAGDLKAGWEERISRTTGGFLTPARWEEMRARVREGLRNGYLTALMPTATSSSAVGVNECFEPFTSMCYKRRTSAGEFVILNRHLVRELEERGLWGDEASRHLGDPEQAGSVQRLPGLPDDLRRRYRTARELPPTDVVQHAAARGPFVDQSMSMNHFYGELTLKKVLTAVRRAWRLGLKTGAYYIHSTAAGSAPALQKTVSGTAARSEAAACSQAGECESCAA
jgi:ribonucleoside-diphosphate reductase alpha subunit